MFTHYTNPVAAANIVTTQELWGRPAGPMGIGGAVATARAVMGSHNPTTLVPGVKKAVEFTTSVVPSRTPFWMGSLTALWEDGTLGTKTVVMGGVDTVIVPITTTGVF